MHSKPPVCLFIQKQDSFQAFEAGGSCASTRLPMAAKYVSADDSDAKAPAQRRLSRLAFCDLTQHMLRGNGTILPFSDRRGAQLSLQAHGERRCLDRPVTTMMLDIIYLIKLVSVVLESTPYDPTCWPSGVGWDIRLSLPPHLTPLLLSLHAVLPSRRPGHRVMRPSGADRPRRIRRRIILQPWFSFPMRIPGASPLRAIIRNHITASTRVHHNAITRRLAPATPPDVNQMLFDNLT